MDIIPKNIEYQEKTTTKKHQSVFIHKGVKYIYIYKKYADGKKG